jgi:hypothetical protein
MSIDAARRLRGLLLVIPENGDQTANFIIVQEFLRKEYPDSEHDFGYCDTKTQPDWCG